MSNILKEISEKRADDVKAMRKDITIGELITLAKSSPAPRGFAKRIKECVKEKQTALIAEVKRASPSQGEIRHDFDALETAGKYQLAGATCLSVLTEPHWFKGHDEYVSNIRAHINLPVLRKDFMVDPYQIIQSREIGADCILLIMAALSDDQALELSAAAKEYDLDILVEVHDFAERDRVFNLNMPFDLFGINNRNLKTMQIDLDTTLKLSRDLPGDVTVVCESGINTVDDIQNMRDHDIYSFLVGTSLMKQHNIYKATQNLLGA